MTHIVRPAILLAVVLGGLGGCARVEPVDPWLEACEDRGGECGSLRCLDGACTVTCRTNQECAASPGALCQDTCLHGDCGYAAPFDAVCALPCEGEACDTPSDVAKPVHPARFDEPVGTCPAEGTVARRTLLVETSETDYAGPATVADVTFEPSAFTNVKASLALSDRPGAVLTVRFVEGTPDGTLLAPLLEAGRPVSVTLMAGGIENLRYTLLVVRDAEERLLLAYHAGSDQLFQSGLFDTPEILGFTLDLAPLCRSSVADGCFEHQSQALYAGRFSADDSVVLDNARQGERLTVSGSAFAVSFWSQSVDGGKALCESVPFSSRYADFYAVAR